MGMKKRWIAGIVLLLLVIVLAVTNPTEQDYNEFSVSKYGEPDSRIPVEIERINFLLFSTYTPVYLMEKGITHLGICGNFIQISDGQFDYPWWLDLFN